MRHSFDIRPSTFPRLAHRRPRLRHYFVRLISGCPRRDEALNRIHAIGTGANREHRDPVGLGREFRKAVGRSLLGDSTAPCERAGSAFACLRFLRFLLWAIAWLRLSRNPSAENHEWTRMNTNPKGGKRLGAYHAAHRLVSDGAESQSAHSARFHSCGLVSIRG